MSDEAREFFSDLPQRPTGVVDLAARSTPAEASLKIRKAPAERDGFRRLLGSISVKKRSSRSCRVRLYPKRVSEVQLPPPVK